MEGIFAGIVKMAVQTLQSHDGLSKLALPQTEKDDTQVQGKELGIILWEWMDSIENRNEIFWADGPPGTNLRPLRDLNWLKTVTCLF